jgi:hypothetical protein
MQVSSQGLVQTRPHTAGKGFASLIRSIASSNFLLAIKLTYDFTFTPAGQASVQSGIPFISNIYFFFFVSRKPLFPPIIFSILDCLFLFFFVFRRNPHCRNNTLP